MNILIVTHYFPPLNTVASLRLYAFAQYMAESGHDVSVITTRKNGKDGKLDLHFQKESLFTLYELDYIPAPLKSVWRNHQTTTRATEADTAGSSGSARVSAVFSYVRSEYFGSFLEFRDLWVRQAYRCYRELAKRKQYDVVLTSFSPTSPQYVGYLIKKADPRILWVADYRDLWSISPFEKARFPVSFIQRFTESRITRLADVVTTVSEPLRDDLFSFLGIPTFVIENGYFPEDVDAAGDEWRCDGEKHVISYTGTIHKNRRDPYQFFLALKELIETGALDRKILEVHFYGSNSHVLKETVEELELTDIVKQKEQVPRDQSIRIQKSSRALLFLEMNDPVAKGVLTGKLFEYIVSGKPIICVGPTREHETGKLIEKTNTGFVCGLDKELIKKAIVQIFRGKQLEPDWGVIEEYRRDRTTAKLLGIIEDMRSKRHKRD